MRFPDFEGILGAHAKGYDLLFQVVGKDRRPVLRNLVSGQAGTVAARVAFFLLLGLLAACQFPPATRTNPPPPTETPRPEPSPTPTPGPLSEAEAVAMIEDELAARSVDLETARLAIREEPRSLSLRFTSRYDFDSPAYKVQSILVTLLVSRISLRLRPPLEAGIKVSIIPQGSDEVGLHIISIMGSSLEAWAEGTLSDQDFVADWTVGILTKE